MKAINKIIRLSLQNQNRPEKGTGAKRYLPGSSVSSEAKFPVAPVELAPMLHYLHTSSRCFMTLAAMGCIRHSPPKSLHVGLSTLSLHFNGHFPGEPGLAGVY